jgi:hypothetical protein
LVVVDLQRRESRVVELPEAPTAEQPKGVAFNHASANHGLLAVHCWDYLEIYGLDQSGRLIGMSSTGIIPPETIGRSPRRDDGHWSGITIHGAVGWSADGQRIITGSHPRYGFELHTLTGDGRLVSERGSLLSCTPNGLPGGFSNDVLSINHWLPVAPKETPTVEVATPGITATPRLEPTPTVAVATATPVDEPAGLTVYLPAALKWQGAEPE